MRQSDAHPPTRGRSRPQRPRVFICRFSAPRLIFNKRAASVFLPLNCSRASSGDWSHVLKCNIPLSRSVQFGYGLAPARHGLRAGKIADEAGAGDRYATSGSTVKSLGQQKGSAAFEDLTPCTFNPAFRHLSSPRFLGFRRLGCKGPLRASCENPPHFW